MESSDAYTDIFPKVCIQAAGCPRLSLARGTPFQVVPSVPEQTTLHIPGCPWHDMYGWAHQSQVQVVPSVPEGQHI